MNAQTKLSAKGQVVIPKDVRERLHWEPGTRLEVIETLDGIALKLAKRKSPFPPTTIEDVLNFPKWEGPPKSVEEISGLSDAALRAIFEERDGAGSRY